MNKKDLNYRKKPSVLPLRSPSPDFVTHNNITPTHSPNKYQIINPHNHSQSINVSVSLKNKYKTPNASQEKNSQIGHNYSTQIYSHIKDSRSTTQRNQLIAQLRKILRMISDNQRVSQFKSEDYLRQSIVRDQYQKLRVENQTLHRILRMQNSSVCTHHCEIQGLKRENIQLRQTLNSMHERYQRQIEGLILENRNNKNCQTQNIRLLQFLRDREQNQIRLLIEIKDLKMKIQSSEEYLIKSASFQQRTLKDQIQSIKYMFELQMQKYNNHNISQLHILEKKVSQTNKRLQTVLRFCIANIKMKQKSQILKKSKILKQSYQAQYQQQSRKLHNVINQLHNEKSQLWKKCEKQISTLNIEIERLHIDIQHLKEKLRKSNLIIQQKEHRLYLIENNQSTSKKKDQEIMKLKQIIRELNEQINQFGRQRQDKSSKLTLTIEELRSQQSRMKSYYQSQINQKNYEFDTLKTQTEKKIRQLAETFSSQRQYMNKEIQSKNSKIKELSGRSENDQQLIININTLKNSNIELQSEIHSIKSSYQKREQQLTIKLREVNQKLKQLNLRIEQKDQQLQRITQENSDIKNRYYLLLQENKKYQLRMSSKQDLQSILKSKSEEWQIKEQQMKKDFNSQLQIWKETSDRKSYQCKILYQSLHRARSISLLEDLKKLQDIAHISKTEVTDSAITNLSSAYEKMSIQFQSKIAQNERLQKQVIQIRDEKITFQKERAQLIEKIRCLQNNIQIYVRQLNQRRQLCQGLIQQKCTLEKQVLLLKKSSTDNRSLHTTIERIIQVSHKIDDLIQIQVQRQKGFSMIESYIVQNKSDRS